VLLGNAKLETTALYTKAATRAVRVVISPLDKLGIFVPTEAPPDPWAVRSTIEVADIFRSAGPAYRAAHAGHLSLSQLKVMPAIKTCRTAAVGGHVEACSDCGHQRIAYNSCRNRHFPRCKGAAAPDQPKSIRGVPIARR
jgi:hypothetical protein